MRFNVTASVPFSRGRKTVLDYYVDMSAAADGKIAGLRTPLLAVSALDDPIMTAAGSPIEDLEMIEDLFILLTKWVFGSFARWFVCSWVRWLVGSLARGFVTSLVR